jgi:hypothetical protein
MPTLIGPHQRLSRVFGNLACRKKQYGAVRCKQAFETSEALVLNLQIVDLPGLGDDVIFPRSRRFNKNQET